MKFLSFRGWTCEDEKQDTTEPWETFSVVLWAHESGDLADDPADVQSALAASGYRLRLERFEPQGAHDA